MSRTQGLRPIGESIKKIIEKLQKERAERKKKNKSIRTQPKLPGLKKGKKVIVPPKKPKKKFSTDADLPYAMTIDTTTSAYGDAGKGRPVPKYKTGGLSDYYKDII